jgi:hypothetical protein
LLWIGRALVFVLLLYSRSVQLLAGATMLLAAWLYYGSKHVQCRDTGSLIKACGEAEVLSAAHSHNVGLFLLRHKDVLFSWREVLPELIYSLIASAIILEFALIGLNLLYRQYCKDDVNVGDQIASEKETCTFTAS